MRKLALLTLLLSSSAYAADIAPLPRVAPNVVYAPAWSGFYAGLNGGYGFGDTQNTNDTVPGIVLDTSPRGAVVGGFVGYNYQLNNFVLGLESDINYSWIKGSTETSGKIDTVPFAVRAENHLDWLGTTRARLGYALGSVLVYGTGGVAYGGVSSDYIASIGSSSLNSSFAQSYSTSATKVGWTAGAGLEYLLTSNIALRGEYLYYDLGKTTDNLDGVNVSADHRGSLARAAVSFKF